MKPSGRAIRIYGTNDRYGEPGWSPSDQPYTVADFPRAGATVSVTFGKVPDVVQRELSDRIAIANAMLDAITGQATVGGLHDLLPSRELLSFEEYAFYVTLAMDRDVNLEYAPADPSGVWINPFELEEADREIRDDAAQAFDTVVARLAPVLGSGFFSERRDERDVVIFKSPGQPSLFFPSFSLRARASVGRDAASFPSDALEQRLGELPRLNASQHRWLSRAQRWYAAALTTDDRWRRFQALFFALEVLTHRLARLCREEVLTDLSGGRAHLDRSVVQLLIWDESRMPLASEFAIVACVLYPQGSVADVATFARVKAARDALSHGSVVDDDQLPLSDAEQLVERYLELAFAAAK